MSEDNFKYILNKIKPYTNYLYFHLMGEPLMHPNISKFIDIASIDFKINITTNGYLIKRIEDNKNIRQVNISLQSFNPIYKKDIDSYINDIYKASLKLKSNNTIINYRIWVNNEYSKYFINTLEKLYSIKINGNTKLDNNIYIDFQNSFIWPSLDNNYYNDKGSCRGLLDHIGIFSDGSVVPCCLDYNNNFNLGNIYNESIEDILSKKVVNNMINGFKNNYKCEDFCKHCNFYDRITKK
jgi:radical SAM protein with 4Fe4S-binding SPASM domain